MNTNIDSVSPETITKMVDEMKTKRNSNIKESNTSKNDKNNTKSTNIYFETVLFSDKKNIPSMLEYSPQSLSELFLRTSSDPRFYKLIGIPDSSQFSSRVDAFLERARFNLSELYIDPYTRMAGEFHIRSIQILKDALMPKLALLSASPALLRDDVIQYHAEMAVICTAAERAKDFVNHLS